MYDDITCEDLHHTSMGGLDDIICNDLTYKDRNPEVCQNVVLGLKI